MTITNLTIPFGKYKGETLDDIPAQYLLWLSEQDWIEKFPEVAEYIQKNRKALEEDATLNLREDYD